MSRITKQMVEAQVCGTCVHYRQHYVLCSGGKFRPLWYGHCHLPRPRYPAPDSVCPRWQAREAEEPELGRDDPFF